MNHVGYLYHKRERERGRALEKTRICFMYDELFYILYMITESKNSFSEKQSPIRSARNAGCSAQNLPSQVEVLRRHNRPDP